MSALFLPIKVLQERRRKDEKQNKEIEGLEKEDKEGSPHVSSKKERKTTFSPFPMPNPKPTNSRGRREKGNCHKGKRRRKKESFAQKSN